MKISEIKDAFPIRLEKLDKYQQYIEYINNASPVTPEQFDEDWEPIGPMVRQTMLKNGWIQHVRLNGVFYLEVNIEAR